MKVLFEILVIIAVLTFSQLVFSQDTWTLDDCVAYALEHNLQLNDLEYTVDANRETYRQSFRELLPAVQGTSEYSIRFGRSVDPNDNSFIDTDFFSNSYALEASVDLFQGFQKQNAIKASKFLFKAAEEETLQQKYLLAFRVMQAFYDIQFFEGSLKIAQEQEGISQSNFDLVEKQIELGLMAGADLYEAESILLTDKLSVTRASNQLIAAKLALVQEMNLTDADDITIVPEVEREMEAAESVAMQSDSIYQQAQDFIPIVKAARYRTLAAEKQLAIERGKLYPSLSLFGGYGTGYFETITDGEGKTIPFREQFKDNTYQVVGISLNIPITDGWSARSRVKQQKIARLRAENDLNLQEQQLFQVIQQLVQQANAFEVEQQQTIKNTKAQSLAFQVAQKRYEKGLINAIELYTAKNLFATAQNQNLQVRLSAAVNKSTLDFYRGLSVFNIKAPSAEGVSNKN